MTSRDYVAIEDLERFFADLTDAPTEARYRGVAFTTVTETPQRFEDRGRQGTYVRIRFTDLLNLDLHLETRESGEFDLPSASEPTDPYGRSSMNPDLIERLHRVFRWSAASEALLFELLRGRMGETLLTIARAHYLEMNDRGIEYGPIQGAPKDEAAALDALVRVVAYMPKPLYNEAELALPRAASGQCPACSTPVDSGASTCPSCGLSLG